MALFTNDVYQYLHNPGIGRVLDDGVRSAFARGVETVVVSHSLGTVVAYNVLKKAGAERGLKVPLFVTLGSPLGVKVVKRAVRPIGYPGCASHWFNAMDERDVVALFALDDKHFDIDPDIENKTDVDNPTSNRHGISGYLGDPEVARRIHEALTAAVAAAGLPLPKAGKGAAPRHPRPAPAPCRRHAPRGRSVPARQRRPSCAIIGAVSCREQVMPYRSGNGETRRRGARRGRVALLAAALAAGPACAADDATLVDLVNAWRAEPRSCDGRRMEAAGPLAPVPALAAARTGEGRTLPEALKAEGYQAARAQVIGVTGPGDAQAVMSLLRQRYCRPLMSPDFAEIGVSREGRAWQLVLARPLLSADLGDWREAGREVLRLVNEARASPRKCGERRFDAAPPLAWAPALAEASLAHSRDMAGRDYFSHRGADGSQAGERARRAGYAWRSVGENIAAGQGSPQQAVSAWLSSPHHCENIMRPGYAEMGAAYALDPGSEATIYWTQVFGTPR